MIDTIRPARPDWAIVDFNGVLGLQPTTRDWQELAKASGWTGSVAELQHEFWDRRAAFDLGEVTAEQFWAPLIGPGASVGEVADLDADMWLRIDPYVMAILHRARRSGTRLVMLSNAPEPVAQRIADSDWAGLFEDLVFSCRIKANKPAVQAYRAALTCVGEATPAEVLMIDDRADNCVAARALGMETHHFRGHHHRLANELGLNTSPEQPRALAQGAAVEAGLS